MVTTLPSGSETPIGKSLILILLLLLIASPAFAVDAADVSQAAADLAAARERAEQLSAQASDARSDAAASREALERLTGRLAGAELELAEARSLVRHNAAELYMRADISGEPWEVGGEGLLRRAYAGAIAEEARKLLLNLDAAQRDLDRVRSALASAVAERERNSGVVELAARGAAAELVEAEAEYAALAAAWEREQEAERLARAAESVAPVAEPPSDAGAGSTTTTAVTTTSSTTTTAAPSTTTTVAVGPRTFIPAVEQWRSLVAAYFPEALVDEALSVIGCESVGDPQATNDVSGAAGLFQHLPRYWPERAAAVGFPDATPYDPEANVAAAAWLVGVSLDSGLGAWYFWSCRP